MKKYYKKIQGYILLDMFFYCVLILSSCFMSILLIKFIDGGYKNKFVEIIVLYAILIGIYLLSAYICNILQWKYGNQFRKNLSLDYFLAVLNQNPKDFYGKQLNYYTEFNTQDLKTIEADYLMPMLSIIKSTLTLLIQFFVLRIYIDTYILIIVMFLAIMSLFIPKVTSKKLSKLREKVVLQMKEFQSHSQDLLYGYPWVNPKTKNAFCNENEKNLEKQLQKEYAYGKFKSFSLVLNSGPNIIITFICLILVGISLKQGNMTFGVASALMMNIGTFMEPFSEMVYCINTIHSAKVIKDNFLQFIQKNSIPVTMPDIFEADTIHLKDIDYKTQGFELLVDEIIFEKGKKYLIIGENGTGKSTLLKLLSKQILDYTGSITMGNKDIRQFDTSNQIAYLQQKDHLFLADYKNNVTLFGSYPYDSQHLISEMKIKRENPLKEMSGGEQKIILLDRIFNMNLPFVLLDEPFAELSQENRMKYYDYLLGKENTIIIVSHDYMYHEKFDHIITMEKENNLTRARMN